MSTSELPTPQRSGRQVGAVALLLAASLSAAGGQQRPDAPHQTAPGPRPGVPSTGPRDGPPGGPETALTGTARITGRVVVADTGAPLRGVLVGVVGAEQQGRATTTDADGRYELGGLPAGRYSAVAAKAGYVSVAYGQRRPNERGRPIELDGRRHVANIDFSLARGSVITGRVTDELGEPVANLSVSVMQYRYVSGRRQLVPAGRAHTDDRGQYRVFGLPAGDYYVSAFADDTSPGAPAGQPMAIAATYFPGTLELHEAQRVRVGTGEESAAVSFAIVPARPLAVSGTVVDSAGDPAHSGVVIMRAEGPAMLARPSIIPLGPGGTFSIGGLAPGAYALHVSLGEGPDAAESAAVSMTMTSADLTGVTIVTSPASRITGELVFESTPAHSVMPSEFRFVLRPDDPVPPTSGVSPFAPDHDWGFQTLAHRSPAFFHAFQTPDGWALKAVLYGGVDVMDSGLEFRSGERVDGVQLVISNRFGTVIGTVVDEGGRPVSDFTAVAFAEEPSRWTPMSRYVAIARPSQHGTFAIDKLPAGRYLAAAVDYLEEGRHGDPEYLEMLRAYATPFELRDGERRALKLEVVHVD